jgi:hypothetical protein
MATMAGLATPAKPIMSAAATNIGAKAARPSQCRCVMASPRHGHRQITISFPPQPFIRLTHQGVNQQTEHRAPENGGTGRRGAAGPPIRGDEAKYKTALAFCYGDILFIGCAQRASGAAFGHRVPK